MSSYLRALRQATIRATVTVTSVLVVTEVTTHLPSQGRASETYHRLVDNTMTPILRQYLSPETAHDIALLCARIGLAPIYRPNAREQEFNLSTTVCNIKFPNPIGLAAGFDKDGSAIVGIQNMGFGFVEIGSVTPLPQPGNPKPRMFRLLQDNAIINRYGFNSKGLDTVQKNLDVYRKPLDETLSDSADEESSKTQPLKRFLQMLRTISKYYTFLHKTFFPLHFYTPSTIVGVNLGKNKNSQISEIDDYCHGIRTLGKYADYIVINISSPNTPGLRDLQESSKLHSLIVACTRERNKLKHRIPILIKLAPDLSNDDLQDIGKTLMTGGSPIVDGLIICNTTNQRPGNLLDSNVKDESGGLSGEPLKNRSTECIKILYASTEGKIPIIGVGGISSAQDVLEKLKAGASLVQIYSVLVYEGPGVVTRLRHDLAALLQQGGFRSVQDVVGYDHEELYWKRKEAERKKQEYQYTIVIDNIDDKVIDNLEPTSFMSDDNEENDISEKA
jgi:dihydroorotate dehydrogenase